MGRSRGGLTTKIHAVVDAHGLPVLFKVATRFDKHDANFLASAKLAAIRLWLRFNGSVI